MEADWLVEIGPGLPVIDGAWEGSFDLRSSLGDIESIEEAGRNPALRDALLNLNRADSPVFTTKCDVWMIPAEQIDPDEFAATDETARVGIACYIDVLERDAARFSSFEFHEQRAREIAAILRGVSLRESRADVVVRRAHLEERAGFGLTVYVAGCGAAQVDAAAAWQAALGAVVAATIAAAQPDTRASSSIG